jgi:RecB family exonuclease
LENYVQDGTDMPLGLEKFEPTGDAIRAMCGEKLCEYKMALTAEKQPTGYKDADVWVRGIADVLIINGENARVCDYKTGGAKYPDKDQLELMALMTFAHFPQVQSVKGALLFVSHDVLVRGAYARKDIDKLWVKWDASTALLDKAFDLDVWYPNPTPLCRWCPHEVCEHYVR